MPQEVLYRKYRPSTWADVVGQEHIVSALTRAIESGRVAHAYLFSGPRGTGKTSLARIFARAVGTSERDLYEIDAASNTGVDDVRALREEVVTLPFESKYKVYILDEAHMLSKAAWNALLKTLEEPPAHAVFILATTEFAKVPETIVSRCQVFTVRRPSNETLVTLAQHVAVQEGYTLAPEAAELVALLAEGSFRDMHGTLEKVMMGAEGKELTRAIVEAQTGVPKNAQVLELLTALHEGSLNRALGMVRTLNETTIDPKVLMKLILKAVRAVLLFRFAPELREELSAEFGADDARVLEAMAQQKPSRINSTLLTALLSAYDRTGSTFLPTLPLELALIDVLGEEPTP